MGSLAPVQGEESSQCNVDELAFQGWKIASPVDVIGDCGIRCLPCKADVLDSYVPRVKCVVFDQLDDVSLLVVWLSEHENASE